MTNSPPEVNFLLYPRVGEDGSFPPQVNRAIAEAPELRSRRTVFGPRWVWDGDSITINGITANTAGQDRSKSWTAELARLSLGRIDYIYNAAVSGYRLDQMLARFDDFVAPQQPDVVFLTAGTNDVGQGRSLEAFMADVVAYYEKCRAIGAQLVIGAIWPTSSNSPSGRPATSRLWNLSIYNWARNNGVTMVPWERLADPDTGGWPTGWSSDSIHPGNLDSYAQIGKFAWDILKHKVGSEAVRRATVTGADALSNGFFTQLTSYLPPNLTNGVATTGTGTLPAGTYSYKYTSRTFYGESLPSVERQVTLSATGQITITNSTISGARGYRIYRKAPGDTTWKYLTYSSVGTNTTFVDDGSYIPGVDAPTVSTAQVPTGLTAGSSTLHQLGPVTFTEPGIRGRIYRAMPYESGSTGPNDYFGVNVVAGEIYEASCLIRTSGDSEGMFAIRFRDAANANLTQVYLARDRMPNGFGLAHGRVVVPPTATLARVSFECVDSTAVGYADFAEAAFRKIA